MMFATSSGAPSKTRLRWHRGGAGVYGRLRLSRPCRKTALLFLGHKKSLFSVLEQVLALASASQEKGDGNAATESRNRTEHTLRPAMVRREHESEAVRSTSSSATSSKIEMFLDTGEAALAGNRQEHEENERAGGPHTFTSGSWSGGTAPKSADHNGAGESRSTQQHHGPKADADGAPLAQVHQKTETTLASLVRREHHGDIRIEDEGIGEAAHSNATLGHKEVATTTAIPRPGEELHLGDSGSGRFDSGPENAEKQTTAAKKKADERPRGTVGVGASRPRGEESWRMHDEQQQKESRTRKRKNKEHPRDTDTEFRDDDTATGGAAAVSATSERKKKKKRTKPRNFAVVFSDPSSRRSSSTGFLKNSTSSTSSLAHLDDEKAVDREDAGRSERETSSIDSDLAGRKSSTYCHLTGAIAGSWKQIQTISNSGYVYHACSSDDCTSAAAAFALAESGMNVRNKQKKDPPYGGYGGYNGYDYSPPCTDWFKVSGWTGWTKHGNNCVKNCAYGKQKYRRTRTVENHECSTRTYSSGGWQEKTANLIEENERHCDCNDIKLVCQYDQWAEWTSCSSSGCEDGVRRRSRAIIQQSNDCATGDEECPSGNALTEATQEEESCTGLTGDDCTSTNAPAGTAVPPSGDEDKNSTAGRENATSNATEDAAARSEDEEAEKSDGSEGGPSTTMIAGGLGGVAVVGAILYSQVGGAVAKPF
ncbi:unnamed protein product [Amoebophrya sp. A120]|nr:unnamed protein product [Amoebophrya sp. A120]|eukprot:GSA120T00006724001.1